MRPAQKKGADGYNGSHTTSHYNTGRIRATHMRAALITTALGQAKLATGRKKHTI